MPINRPDVHIGRGGNLDIFMNYLVLHGRCWTISEECSQLQVQTSHSSMNTVIYTYLFRRKYVFQSIRSDVQRNFLSVNSLVKLLIVIASCKFH